MPRWPDRVQVIVNALAAKHPDLVQGDDEARRKLTGFFAEQCRFELGPAWGRKRYGGGPISADIICYKDHTMFIGWDTQLAGGVITQWPDSIDLSVDPEHKFIAVDPVDHLGSASPGPAPQPDLTYVLEQLKLIHSYQLAAREHLAEVHNLLKAHDSEKHPTLAGKFKLSYFGDTKFTLDPL